MTARPPNSFAPGRWAAGQVLGMGSRCGTTQAKVL